MKKFMDEDFLLQNDVAVKLYNEVKDLPIIDYHCHLDPKEIAENRSYSNITQLWLGGDHYKWRLMRAYGIDEKYITGDGDDYEKFEYWCAAIESAIGSPLYHWTHLELIRYFGYKAVLSKKTAKDAWEHCNKIINAGDFRVWNILDKFNVQYVCTTDDPADTLEYHKAIRESELKCKVLPAFRPSKAMALEDAGFAVYAKKLSGMSGISINGFDDMVTALYNRIDFFHEEGCRLSDHALDPPVYVPATPEELDAAVKKALSGEPVSENEANKYKTALLTAIGKKYAEKGWVMQLHMSGLRNNNSRMFKLLGADTGFDAINDVSIAAPLSRILDALAADDHLPKTILYCLDPAADDVIAALMSNFQGGGVKGKMQSGSAWWFNDTKTGMQKQMIALANNGLLSAFVGMLTDSRSFLSYTRHEYFRRVMINLLAEWVENGEFPHDMEMLEGIAKDISYYNALNYFGFA